MGYPRPVSPGLRAADLALRLARGLVRVLPPRVRKSLDDRFFGAVFQVTRVTNDAYGHKPPPPGNG